MRRIGVSGVGSIGLRHVRLLAERADIQVIAYDAVPRDLPNGVQSVPSFVELLDHGLDALIVATPDEAHAPQTVAAAERGIPVLVEKPVADSVAAGPDLIRAAEQVPVLVGYVLRHYAVVRQVSQLLADGALGTPVSAQVSLGAYETLRLARNRFRPGDRYRLAYDYSHEWDYLQWFLGPAQRVCATGRLAGDLPLIQEPNTLDGVLILGEGLAATFHLDYVQEGGGRRLEVVGDRGTLRAELAGGTIRHRRHGEAVVHEYDCTEPRDTAFTRQHDHFLDLISGAVEQPVVTVQDGLNAIAVADAVVASCEGAGWVAVSGLSSPRRP